MIQRIQTVYLLIVALLAAMQFYFGLHYSYMLALIAAGALIPLVSIFLYKNRKLQIKLNYLNILLFLSTFGLGIFVYEEMPAYISLAIPPVNIIFTYLAIRAIKKDENLVKSLDRIR